MINGVLVERTVKDVVPALKTNSDGLKKLLDDLLKQYKDKQDDMEKWKVRASQVRCGFAHTADDHTQKKNNIQVVQQ
jgi:prefoldin subunit 2